MYHYLVWVATPAYHREDPLTYASADSLKRGSLVSLPLQNKKVLGIVEGQVARPQFPTKEIFGRVSDAPLPEQFLDLIKWLRSYYPSPFGPLLLSTLPSALISAPRSKPLDTPQIKEHGTPLPPLTTEQQKALDAIRESAARSYLLHGETGSGKTRVYLELSEDAFRNGRSALILTPEIGLTPQLTQVFEARFGSRVHVIHSMLTSAKRRDIWLSILHDKDPLIVIGPRSALFSPIQKLGLIIMDEAHEGAYKQEQVPYYQTSRVAAKLADLHGAKFVMGTATPTVADYYAYQQKGLPIVRMGAPAIAVAEPPQISTVKLDDRTRFNHSPYISDDLRLAVQAALGAQEQSLIYLNRRGTARVVLCQQCGWQALCPRCDVPLTYHGDTHQMRCHICGFKESAPTACPVCSNADISFRSIGTKSLATELSRLFPHSRIKRFDTDVGKDERLESQYEKVHAGEIDILVGTQLLGKGLDLPKLSVVGVVTADTSLSMPDFTADETTFQQLSQIIGRVGRGHRRGKVIIQSYNPENAAIQAAIKKDYGFFYENQLKERDLFGFPPFRYLLKLECSRASSKSAENAAGALIEKLAALRLPVEIIGPSPSFRGKIADKYRWQIVVKSKQRTHLLRIIDQLPANWHHDIDPTNLL